MVVGGLPVVITELAEFLRDGLFVVGGLDGCAVLGVAARPAGGVGTGDVVVFERSRHAGHTVAAEIALAHIGTPCEGVAIAHSGVAHFHELVERQIVALGPAPVVLDFEDKLGVEGMVGVGGEGYIVVGVETEIVSGILLRRVSLAAGNYRLRQFAEIVLIDIGEVALPGGRDFLQVALGDGTDIGGSHGIELVEVEERVAIERTGEGHGVLRHDAVVLEAIDGIVERTALREAGVAVGANGLVGAVHIGVVYEEGLAEVVLALAHAQEFGFEETEGGIGPAGAGAVLVFNGGDGVLLDDGELYGVFLHLFFFLLCHYGCGGHEERQGHEDDFFHKN